MPSEDPSTPWRERWSPRAPGRSSSIVAVVLCGLAFFFGMIQLGTYWMARPMPAVVISHSVRALPLYAFYSVVRIGIAYLLSLIFAVGYGYIAAYNPRVEAWMIAVLDILQSIPVLSFLPGVMLAMMALVPGHQLGIEMGSILLIFTGQVWNMAFSFYSSLKSIPARDDRSLAHLPLLGLAALLAARNALCRHRPDLEFHRLGCRRMVLPHRLRDVRLPGNATSVCPAWAAICKPRPRQIPSICTPCSGDSSCWCSSSSPPTS